MAARELRCPRCGEVVQIYRNPIPTVDIIIEVGDRIVLISRRNPPYGWAIPGGFVDYGESLEEAALREAKEETGLDVQLSEQFYTYSDPERDPRHHTITTVYIAKAEGTPRGLDDAERAGLFSEEGLPEPLAFDHGRILRDYFEYRRTGRRPQPLTSHSAK
ncbi:MAG: NUDIX hydrolase [Candidatus Latescibacterota bacterium]|nr:MAG: NUDIX hydrolase [Candidatus Latescibacterota bacterium]